MGYGANNTTGKLIFYCDSCGIKRMSRASVIDGRGRFLKPDTDNNSVSLFVVCKWQTAERDNTLAASSKFETKTVSTIVLTGRPYVAHYIYATTVFAFSYRNCDMF